MNKREILEIRKQYSPERCAIQRICGCYVDAEKNIRTQTKDAFLSLPEEETFKYFELFKKTLSGSLGKNLLNLDFPKEAEISDGQQEFLLRLRDSELKDDALLEEFYNRIIENYPYAENYYIILIHVVYDIPGKSLDGSEMFDASDEVYEYLLCSLCPVKLSKPGLAYQPDKSRIENRIRDWVVDAPMHGFLFPAFNDRSTDIHSMLYSSRKAEELRPDFVQTMFGCRVQLSADGQRDVFRELISRTLGEDTDFDMVRSIHGQLLELVEENIDAPDPLELTRNDVCRLFEVSGVPDEKMEAFNSTFDEVAGEGASLLAANIVSRKAFRIESSSVVVEVDAGRTDLIETRIIDGRQCLVIAVDGHMEVDGVMARTVSQMEEEQR